MNAKIKIVVIVNSLLLLVLIGLTLSNFLNKSEPEIIFVDNQEVFEKFKMTGDMRRLGMEEIQKRQAKLDVIHMDLQKEDLEEDQKKQLMQQLISGRKDLDQFNQNFSVEETQKIWIRIKSYTKMYAQQKGYKVVLGSSNQQNVLYTEASQDRTNQLLAYINDKYEGN